MKEKYIVKGMYCSACVANVERRVSRLDGVNKVNVSLINNSMIVTYDETLLNSNKIIETVKKGGYNAYLDDGRIVNDDKVNKRLYKLIASISIMILLMIVSMGHMIGINLPFNMLTIAIIELILASIVIILNFFFFKDGFEKLIKLSPNMNSLIAIAATSAVIYSLVSLIRLIISKDFDNHSYHFYFESAAMVLTLVSLGKFIEYKAKGKTTKAVDELINLIPKKAIRVKDGIEEEIFIEEIEINDVLIVKSGDNIPVDGIVIDGESEVDEALISGESKLIYKKKDDKVISSSLNINGKILIKATSTSHDSTIAKIIELVEEAANSKAPISRLADKISRFFVPIVIGIAILAFFIWILISKDFTHSFNIGISVLLISCPCALGLATPLAIMIASGKGAKNSILFKDAESIETLQDIKTICIDKTGTVTKAKMKVIEAKEYTNEALKIIYSLERNVYHPLSLSIKEYYEENSNDYYEVNNFNNIIGRGIEGIINNTKYYFGNIELLKEHNININDINIIESKINLFLFNDKEVLANIVLEDEIKESSIISISKLKELGLNVIMISGDSDSVCEEVSNILGGIKYFSNVLPEVKGKIISELKKDSKVCFVGDGINDAIALTSADIGIAIGAGSDVAISSANIILMKNDLSDVVKAIKISKKTINNIKLSLFWAFFYNILLIPVACGVLYPIFKIELNPMIASFAMSLSSISVVLNALRLNRIK